MTVPSSEQDAALAIVNDKWSVAQWTVQPDGVMLVELDDGDEGVIEPDGSNTWGVS